MAGPPRLPATERWRCSRARRCGEVWNYQRHWWPPENRQQTAKPRSSLFVTRFDVGVHKRRVLKLDWFRPCKNDIFYRFSSSDRRR